MTATSRSAASRETSQPSPAKAATMSSAGRIASQPLFTGSTSLSRRPSCDSRTASTAASTTYGHRPAGRRWAVRVAAMVSPTAISATAAPAANAAGSTR
jgi:hypothetical protein